MCRSRCATPSQNVLEDGCEQTFLTPPSPTDFAVPASNAIVKTAPWSQGNSREVEKLFVEASGSEV